MMPLWQKWLVVLSLILLWSHMINLCLLWSFSVCGSHFESEGRSSSKTRHILLCTRFDNCYWCITGLSSGAQQGYIGVSNLLLGLLAGSCCCHMPGKHRKPINRLSKAFLCPWHRLNLKKRTMMDEKSIEGVDEGRGRNEVFILTRCDVLNRPQCCC